MNSAEEPFHHGSRTLRTTEAYLALVLHLEAWVGEKGSLKVC